MKTASTILAVALVSTACTRTARMPLRMISGLQTNTIDDVPQYVELHHVEDGWVRVPIDAGDPKMQWMERGVSVDVALAQVPRGRYDAVRVGFITPMTETITRVVRSAEGVERHTSMGEAAWVHDESQGVRTFCAKGKKNNDLTLKLTAPEGSRTAPSIEIVDAPEC